MQLILRRYLDARLDIVEADMLLFRPRDLVGRIIGLAAKDDVHDCQSNYCHVGRAIWWGASLWVVQQTSNPYKHLERLSRVVAKWPCIIDVYTLRVEFRPQFSRFHAVETHKDICLRPYGWRNLLRLVPRHLPLCRGLLPVDRNDKRLDYWPPFCSMAYSMSDRAGGIDPCPGRADRDTEPHHLAESDKYQYQFTLL